MVTISTDNFFIKQSFRNRTKILTSAGPLDLIIPVEKGNSKQLYRDIKISYAENWIVQHERTMQSAYASSPYYLYFIDDILQIIKTKPIYLVDLNEQLMHFLCKIYDLTKHYNIENKQINEPYAPSKKLEKDFLYSFESLVKPYPQVFSENYGYVSHLSILDYLFNMGNHLLIKT